MRGPVSIGIAIVTLLLTTTPVTGRSQLSLTPGLGLFQLTDSSIQDLGPSLECIVQLGPDYVEGVLGCHEYAMLGSDICRNLNGRVSAAICNRVVTINFDQGIQGTAHFWFVAANGTSTGCTAPTENPYIDCRFGSGTATGAGFGSPKFVWKWCVARTFENQ